MSRRAKSRFVLTSIASLGLALPLTFGGCRFGYEIDGGPGVGLGGALGDGDHQGDGDGDSPGDGDGDAGSGGAIGQGGGTGDGGTPSDGGAMGLGGASAGGTGGSESEMPKAVSTPDDEEDPGATWDDPLGAGLSLREAIILANDEPGRQTIQFDEATTIVLNSTPLPSITDEVEIVGPVRIEGQNLPDASICLTIDASDVYVNGVTVANCPSEPIDVGGSNNEISDCTFEGVGNSLRITGSEHQILRNQINGSSGAGIWCSASDTTIIDNRIEETVVGIQVVDSGSNTLILGNVLIRNTYGIGIDAPAGVRVLHNTVFDSLVAVGFDGATSVDMRSNIIATSSDSGVNLVAGTLDTFASNLFWDNATDCNGCTLGAENPVGDPLFVAPGSDDLSLGAGSPAINVGPELGYDRNGSAAGLFNGTAPDLGALESN